jgi:hypothetical protein
VHVVVPEGAPGRCEAGVPLDFVLSTSALRAGEEVDLSDGRTDGPAPLTVTEGVLDPPDPY